jgi:enoyl-CoA hydratase/carnithine racemase
MMARHDFCTVKDHDRIRIVTINRPEVLNALHRAAHDELDRVWDEFAADEGLWIAIVTGAGERAFSAGNDLKALSGGASISMPLSGFGGITHRFDLDKPVIAAVNGIAMGGGFEIALACDLIIAAENGLFAFPEPRVGLIASAGGIHRLPRVIPEKLAMGMLLTGRRVSAAEGKELGFVNEVVPRGEALAGAVRWAEQILECSPKAIRATKQTFRLGRNEQTLQEAMETIYPAHLDNRKSLDFIEGPRAFAEKRKPNWQNK